MKATHPTFPSIPSLLLALVALVVLAVLDLSGVLPPAEAQIPRPLETPYNMYQVRQYLMNAHFTTTRTVCPKGCDFSGVNAALAYVATQERGKNKQWLIKIWGGVPAATPLLPGTVNYSYPTLTVPSFTTLQGEPGLAPYGASIHTPNPLIELTATSGVQISWGLGSGCQGIGFVTFSDMTGPMTMAKTTGGTFDGTVDGAIHLTDCHFWSNGATGGHAHDIFTNDGSNVVLYNVSTTRGQNGSAASVRNLVNLSGTLQVVSGRHQPAQGLGQVKTVEALSGTLTLNWTRVISGATTAVTVTGGSATQRFSVIPNFSGSLVTEPLYAPTGTGAPATCSPGQLFIDTTASAPKICACTTANTWRCTPLS